jgi:molybdate transport system ATP-binding protein
MIQIEVFKKIHGAKGDMDLDIKLDIKKGSILAITGVSGSGKTTFLKILAGLEKSNSTIKIDDIIISSFVFLNLIS